MPAVDAQQSVAIGALSGSQRPSAAVSGSQRSHRVDSREVDIISMHDGHQPSVIRHQERSHLVDLKEVDVRELDAGVRRGERQRRRRRGREPRGLLLGVTIASDGGEDGAAVALGRRARHEHHARRAVRDGRRVRRGHGTLLPEGRTRERRAARRRRGLIVLRHLDGRPALLTCKGGEGFVPVGAAGERAASLSERVRDR